MPIRFLASLALALFSLFGVATAAESVTFTGEVTYRERIALPPDARLRMTLLRLPGEGVVVSATGQPTAGGQVPLSFTLNVRSSTIGSGGSYGLRAEILSGGQVLFRNERPVAVDPASPQAGLIIVNRAAGPRPGPVAPANPLADTQWVVTAIGGTPVLAQSKVTLQIMADNGAGGRGGCNSYFAETRFEDSPLSFGPVAGTMMACSEALMEQEGRYYDALARTANFARTGKSLHLLDSAGTVLVELETAP
ncbi:MAG: hypothetical protein ABS76_05385 [Pelagibacterium sp. SCN 64-44]|nr:MAG: hypothetical protein ABS76_05385 [Pelagibacterium sp. SCN 64-44]